MRRPVGAAGLGTAALMLAVAPWLGLVRTSAPLTSAGGGAAVGFAAAPGRTLAAAPAPSALTPGCGCESVVIEALNELRDAEIRTGDARSVNTQVTYISTDYLAMVGGRVELEVRQRAKAVSGSATAGQNIGSVDTGGRCAHILIKAINILEDVEVRSGDARAINRNVVLLDPGIDPGSIEIDADQEAEAEVGSATSGQIIGAQDTGDGRCAGGVTVEATNEQTDVELRTGEAKTKNDNDILTCAAAGCGAELLRWAYRAGAVRMCTAAGCSMVPASVLAAQLRAAPSPSPTVTPEPAATTVPEEDDTDDAASTSPPAATPDASPAPEEPPPEPSPTPLPEPSDGWSWAEGEPTPAPEVPSA